MIIAHHKLQLWLNGIFGLISTRRLTHKHQFSFDNYMIISLYSHQSLYVLQEMWLEQQFLFFSKKRRLVVFWGDFSLKNVNAFERKEIIEVKLSFQKISLHFRRTAFSQFMKFLWFSFRVSASFPRKIHHQLFSTKNFQLFTS